jgi:DNA invertase Pin-like site-specific DNA recombinase
MAPTASCARRAIGIVRVSQTNGREGDSFASPDEQSDRIRAACKRDGLILLNVIEELDVSGGTALDRRHGLRRAVEAVEKGDADVIVAAYFDRLVRSLRVQDELVSRVEAAGGSVLALDTGQVTNGSAGQWLSGTMLGAVAEYARRTAAERSGEAQARAVARGVLPWPNIPPGYRRGDDGVLVPDPKTAPIVAQAFQMRADGETVRAVRAFLAGHGIERSYHGVGSLLASRVMLGEIHFGDLVNLTAHEPIVDAELWRAVQRVKVPRGRRAKSDRLLARVGVLRCASCGSRMVVGTANHSAYYLYRCPPNGDCARRVTVSAEMVETIVTGAVRGVLADAEGRASVEHNAQDAARALDRAQADLDAAFRAFAGFEDETAARARLTDLRSARDAAQEQLARLGGTRTRLVSATVDWDQLTLDGRRDLVRAIVKRVTVAPGRGADRVTVELVGE